MTGRVLLDTNIIIALFANDNSVKKHLAETQEVFIPSVAVGELYYGAEKSKHMEDNIARINNFADSNVILSCDRNTAVQYGKIKNCLRKKGTPIPENDIWIAAIVKQHKLILISRDIHFDEIDGLKMQKW
ncbi:MAG: type II toxin-antitoxin system VapC family toxin [Candidatus Scalindua sp.]